MAACRRSPWTPVLVVMGLAGCGGGGDRAAAGPSDAAADVHPETGTDDSGGCFPYCPVGDAAGPAPEADTDGAMSCAALKSSYESLEAIARICNPQIPGSCISTDDPCCKVAVSSGNAEAVNAFADAVNAYSAQCTPDCALRICQPPAGTCMATGTTTGICM
jgi:hypothetical protein